MKRLYWGDLHVHTAYSLDAYGYGTLKTPAEAFGFARGNPIDLPSGRYQMDRPLDFLAVTDHAEWLDLLYTCSDPLASNHPYCVKLRNQSSRSTGGTVFRDFVNPTITEAEPAQADICAEDPDACLEALDSQWQRVQDQANAANSPCDFTAFIGFEWSATPSYSHTHRNIVFANENVTPRPIDYIRFPKLHQLFELLEQGCQEKDGCDAISIAHNMNFGDGQSFDVETETDRELALRARYERLVEITQEKGTSECLNPFSERLAPNDCDYELYITRRSRQTAPSEFERDEWETMRSTYARGLLRRGLEVTATDPSQSNPLEIGFVGSTDSHTGLAGYVEEDQWRGSVFGIGDFDQLMGRLGFSPGGLTGAWAEENTRESLFRALKRREVYATSGPRIPLRVHAGADADRFSCPAGGALVPVDRGHAMGSAITSGLSAFSLRIAANADRTPLQSIEVVKGVRSPEGYQESVQTVWYNQTGAEAACVIWTDAEFDPASHAYWYIRVKEQPTPRWSSHLCREENRCAEFEGADVEIQERAWSSPIWYVPVD